VFTPLSFLCRRLLPLAGVLVVTLRPREARADVSSWFYAGGGMSSMSQDQGPVDRRGTMQLEMGMGSPPHASVIVGGLLKTMTFFGQGTDLAFVTRGASGGFVRGGFGLALDAGGYQRWWGPESSTGFMGSIILGAPFGLQLAAMTEQGPSRTHVYGATLGVDFLRLTVYRTALASLWPNPFPPANADGSR
jgi:hypothetical protein